MISSDCKRYILFNNFKFWVDVDKDTACLRYCPKKLIKQGKCETKPTDDLTIILIKHQPETANPIPQPEQIALAKRFL